jgi:tetratricopeptide (TPR) repeat protein
VTTDIEKSHLCRRPLRRRLSLPLVALLASFGPAVAQAQQVPGCGNLDNPYGPYDYNDPMARNELLPKVEQHHFTPNVEMLRAGQSGTISSDLSYTLRAFPNHPRALDAVSRYVLKGGRLIDPSIPTADCFFKRAMAFRPDDETVRMLFANYLTRRGERDDARAQYEKALELAPESAETNYNAGLFFLQDGDLARAKKLAEVAYANGYPLPGLREKIRVAEQKAE